MQPSIIVKSTSAFEIPDVKSSRCPKQHATNSASRMTPLSFSTWNQQTAISTPRSDSRATYLFKSQKLPSIYRSISSIHPHTTYSSADHSIFSQKVLSETSQTRIRPSQYGILIPVFAQLYPHYLALGNFVLAPT